MHGAGGARGRLTGFCAQDELACVHGRDDTEETGYVVVYYLVPSEHLLAC